MIIGVPREIKDDEYRVAMLPVGVITALTGGPFFLILLVHYTKTVHWGQR